MTLREIAEEVGVSISTVSRVLNRKNPHVASQEIQDRIWEIVRRQNYTTPAQRSGMISQSAPVISCLFAREAKKISDNPFFTGIAQNFEKIALSLNYSTRHYFTATEVYERNFDKLIGEDISGLIIIGRHKEDLIRKIYPRVKNIVYAGLMPPVSDVYDSVVCDAYRIGRAAADYLADLNHVKCGFIGEADNEIRFSGYMDALKERKCEIRDEWIVNLPASMENGYLGMKQILSLKERPTAIFCMNDYFAIGAIKALNDEKVRCPEEISIIGVDNVEASAYTTPKLTTIKTPMEELGQIAAKVLIDRINGGHTINVKVNLPFSIIERESCAPRK